MKKVNSKANRKQKEIKKKNKFLTFLMILLPSLLVVSLTYGVIKHMYEDELMEMFNPDQVSYGSADKKQNSKKKEKTHQEDMPVSKDIKEETATKDVMETEETDTDTAVDTKVDDNAVADTKTEKKDDSSETTESVAAVYDNEVLRFLTFSQIYSLDANAATDTNSFLILGNVMEGLFMYDQENMIVPGVAKDYEVSSDGLTYRFFLREDALWSNGAPVTAHDFVYSWNRLTDPSNDFSYVYMMETSGIYDFYALDDYTFEVQLDHQVPYFISLMAFPSFYPLNEDFVESKGYDFGESMYTTLYNGPYIISEWDYNVCELQKNDNYWDKDNVDIENVLITIAEGINNDTAVSMYYNGEIDLVVLSDLEQYMYEPEYIDVLSSTVFYLELNQRDLLLDNTNARKAISHVIEKSYITDVIYGKRYIPADYFVPNGLAFNPITGNDFRYDAKEYNGFNVELGQKYWEEAKQELGINSYQLELIVSTSNTALQIAETIAGDLEYYLDGLTVSINQLDFSTKLELLDNGDFDIVMSGWGPDYADPMTFLDIFYSESPWNRINYSNPTYDDLIYECFAGSLTTDIVGRWETLIEAERVLLEEDAAIVPLFQRGGGMLVKSYINNFNKSLFGPDYNFKYFEITN